MPGQRDGGEARQYAEKTISPTLLLLARGLADCLQRQVRVPN